LNSGQSAEDEIYNFFTVEHDEELFVIFENGMIRTNRHAFSHKVNSGSDELFFAMEKLRESKADFVICRIF